ncbi:hypothetical protein [Bradyrhizobium elkanii]|uniref:hypothetical protein n=1 Tax=Bradyrhizobium elkanii TaxID=29448 RepID=UPI002167F56F|nr:hypothetical protein [Bradyrhizobium elkanii]MCS3524444.1 hypothetical protein [Bradyrhizobium elkanii]MCS4072100.1 hypothetical protein [Bradyrhizobium elkanii]MCS4078733.1 hypothetical protein [Bradyrhizobium elkanii]MDH6690327.1 hypothetical protein [Bradyrhizobium elkanii]
MIKGNLERLRAHRANIRRYRRLLATRLSDLERAYIARRMSEEQHSVEALLHKTFPDRLSLQTDRRRTMNLEMARLLHPAEAFAHPIYVVDDCDLTSYEKRAILSLWAADACALKDDPELNRTIDGAVSFDDIVDALRLLESDSDRRTNGSNRKGRRFGSHEADDSPAL